MQKGNLCGLPDRLSLQVSHLIWSLELTSPKCKVFVLGQTNVLLCKKEMSMSGNGMAMRGLEVGIPLKKQKHIEIVVLLFT